MEEKEIPALGRPFELGMLYDCRKNNLITNSRIWDEKSIGSFTASHPQPQCDFDFTAEDTISAKTSFLDINADVKLSIFFGWVEVHGSAKYLENHRKFTRQSRVSFKYRCRTHFKELLIKELMSEHQIDPEDLNSENATHVVAGILYGTDAIFVFDRNVTDEEDELQIHSKLEAMVKFLPKASVAAYDNKNKLLDNVKLSYHGDIPLDSEPSSFEEAIKAFKTLPSKIGVKGENCVPMNILLYPLHKLISKKVTLNEPLDVTLVNQIQERLEKLQVLKMKCNDLTATPTCQYDERYRQKVDEMQTTVGQSEQKLKSQLSSEVTAVTSMNLVKGNVRHLLDEYDKSPKSPEKLDNNLLEMRTVINIFDTCVRKIPSSDKVSKCKTKKDKKNQLSQDFGQFELPPIENFVSGLHEEVINSNTDAQRKQSLRSNIFNIRKTMKEDIDMFVSKCTEKGNNYIELPNAKQGADVEISADDVGSRQNVGELQTIIEPAKQKLKRQLSSEDTAVTSIDLGKGNSDNLIDEYDKSSKSHENKDNNLSEMRTTINVLDTCVRKIPSANKDSQSNTQKDNKNKLSQYFGQPELPSTENFVGDLQEGDTCIYSRTDAQRKQSLRSNTLGIRKPVKRDEDMTVSKGTEKGNNYIEQPNAKQGADVEISSDDVRSRQNVGELQTIIEPAKQKLKSQLSSEDTAVTSIDLGKGNSDNLIDEYDKSSKSHEKLENNLSEMRTTINVLDRCVRTIPSSNKDSHSNTQEDNKNKVSQYFGQPELPSTENFVGDQQEGDTCIYSRTDAQREESLRNNTVSIRKTVKNDKDMFVLKCTEKENNNIDQPNVKESADVERCADDVRSRQNVGEMQTIIEPAEQKLKSQLFRSVPAVTSIDLVKGNEENFVDDYDKSFKSPENFDNNLSEIRTVIKDLDTCIRKNPFSHKDSHQNTLEDINYPVSHNDAPLELPPIEKQIDDLQEDDNCTAAQRTQGLVNNGLPMRRTKEDIDISKGEQYVISKKDDLQENYTEQFYVKQEEDVALSIPVSQSQSTGPLRPDQLSVPLIPGKPSVIQTEHYTIGITWQVPPNLPADYTYEVSYRSVYEREWTIYPLASIKEPSVEIVSFLLNAETNYVFRVRCKSGGVFGDYSEVSDAIKRANCIIL